MFKRRTQRVSRSSGWLGLLGWALLSCAAWGQNAVSNAEFNDAEQVYGWIGGFGQLEWSGTDSQFCVGSGSALATSLENPGDPSRPNYFSFQQLGLAGCLQVSPLQNIYVDFYYMAGADIARPLLRTFTSVDCSTGEGATYNQVNGPAAAWTHVVWTQSNTLAGVASVAIAFDGWRNSSPFTAAFDRVYLGSAPRIFSADFEAGVGTCPWSSAAP